MEYSITEIKAVGNVILSLNGQLICQTEPIWEPGDEDPWIPGENLSKKPAAFLLDEDEVPAQLEVTFQVPDKNLEPGKYTVTGVYEKELFFGSVEISDYTEKIVINVFNTINPQQEFTRIADVFTWQITMNDTQGSVECKENTTGLELFWLYGKCKDPVFNDVFIEGIPVEILRHIAPIYQVTRERKEEENKNDVKKILIESVVNACFHRNPPAYDINKKESHFIDSSNGLTLRLKKYLNAIYFSYAFCNCFDQAAVLQVFLMAVGITDVKYCQMSPFGYLKLTNLIGRGFCNTPKDSGIYPIVYEKYEDRSYFGNHGFCILSGKGKNDPCEDCIHNGDKPGDLQKSNCLVVDSCLGPHIGNEIMKAYVESAVDEVYPENPGVNPGTVDDIKCYKGVTHINFTFANIKDKSEWIKQVIQKDKKIINNIINNFVVRKWSNPKNCRVLKRKWKAKDWDTICKYEEIIPGIGETIKTCILIEKGEYIDIDLYVSSEKWASINRFFCIKILASLPFPLGESPFKEVSEGLKEFLGPLSAAIETENYCRYLWVFYNVVFDVTLHNVTFNIKKLLIWLNRQGRCILKKGKFPWEEISSYLPQDDSIICEHHFNHNQVIVDKEVTVKPGDLLIVKFEPSPNKQNKPEKNKDILLDFIYEKGDGLEVISKTDSMMKFRAIKPSENKNTTTLVVVALDKDTLLTRTKKYEITVTTN